MTKHYNTTKCEIKFKFVPLREAELAKKKSKSRSEMRLSVDVFFSVDWLSTFSALDIYFIFAAVSRQ